MSVPTIGYQDGINGTKLALEALDPPHRPIYEKLAATLRTLEQGHNEVWKSGGLADRMAALEARPRTPFPASS